MTKVKYYILMVFATLLFAGAFIAGKLSSNDFSPIVMTFLRIGLATLILYPIMLMKEGYHMSKADLFLAFKLGLVGMTFYHLFFFTALKYTSASNAAVINASMPIITALIASVVLKERLATYKYFFIITAFVGVLTIITSWDIKVLLNMSFNKGDLIMMCGTVSWASYGVMIKKSNHSLSPLKLTTYTLLMCTIIVAPFALFEIIKLGGLNAPIESYYSIIYMALFPTVIGYTIQQGAIKALGPSNASLFINLVPFFSIILSVIILGDSIQPLNIVSGIIIIASVLLFTRKQTAN